MSNDNKSTACVEDLQELIFDPTLDAGIELQRRIKLLIEERDTAIAALAAPPTQPAQADEVDWSAVDAALFDVDDWVNRVNGDDRGTSVIVNALDRAIKDVRAALTQRPAAPVAEKFARVPKRMTRAMREVVDTEGWEWRDLLAAAEAITEDQYNAECGDTEAGELAAAAQAVVDRWDTPHWKDAAPTAEYIGRLRAALNHQRGQRIQRRAEELHERLHMPLEEAEELARKEAQ